MKIKFNIQNRMKNKLLITVIILMMTIVVSGQDSFKGYAINPKLGFFNNNKVGGFAGGVEVNYIHNSFLFSLDYIRMEEFDILGPEPKEGYSQIGLMVGKFTGNKYLRFQYQAGFASLWGLKRTDFKSSGSGFLDSDLYYSKNFFTVGLVAKLGFKVMPFNFMSIGIDINANINKEQPSIIPMLSIEFGSIRK